MFTKAAFVRTIGRLFFCGPSGSGKTYSSLLLATGMVEEIKRLTDKQGKIALLDTEGGRSCLYARLFDFDIQQIESFEPENYIAVIREAEAAGYTVLIIDSLTHAWAGPGGALEQVDKATALSRSHNSFTDGWKNVTPRQNALIRAILTSKIHIICTVRKKMEWVMDKTADGKTYPHKVGLKNVQRDDTEYEFDLEGEFDHEQRFFISKNTIHDGKQPSLTDYSVQFPTKELGARLASFFLSAEHVDAPAPVPPQNLEELRAQCGELLNELVKQAGLSGDIEIRKLATELRKQAGVSANGRPLALDELAKFRDYLETKTRTTDGVDSPYQLDAHDNTANKAAPSADLSETVLSFPSPGNTPNTQSPVAAPESSRGGKQPKENKQDKAGGKNFTAIAPPAPANSASESDELLQIWLYIKEVAHELAAEVNSTPEEQVAVSRKNLNLPDVGQDSTIEEATKILNDLRRR